MCSPENGGSDYDITVRCWVDQGPRKRRFRRHAMRRRHRLLQCNITDRWREVRELTIDRDIVISLLLLTVSFVPD